MGPCLPWLNDDDFGVEMAKLVATIIVDESMLSTTARPETGTTARPETGTTARPETGTTTRPETGNTTGPETGTTTGPETGTTRRPETGNTTRPETGNTTRPETGNTTTTETATTTKTATTTETATTAEITTDNNDPTDDGFDDLDLEVDLSLRKRDTEAAAGHQPKRCLDCPGCDNRGCEEECRVCGTRCCRECINQQGVCFMCAGAYPGAWARCTSHLVWIDSGRLLRGLLYVQMQEVAQVTKTVRQKMVKEVQTELISESFHGHDDAVYTKNIIHEIGADRNDPTKRCEICDAFSSVPHALCWYCGAAPSWHHGRCCPAKPQSDRVWEMRYRRMPGGKRFVDQFMEYQLVVRGS
jgi:hypothetical protein